MLCNKSQSNILESDSSDHNEGFNFHFVTNQFQNILPIVDSPMAMEMPVKPQVC